MKLQKLSIEQYSEARRKAMLEMQQEKQHREQKQAKQKCLLNWI